jgi:hypothetical protein
MWNTDVAFLSTVWFRKLPKNFQGAILEAAYKAQAFQHSVYVPYMRDQWGIFPDSPPDSMYKKLKIDTVFLNDQERAAWRDYLSYEKNKGVFDPLIQQFGKVEYDAVGRAAQAPGAVEPRRWWASA